jgi:hypothetical protein
MSRSKTLQRAAMKKLTALASLLKQSESSQQHAIAVAATARGRPDGLVVVAAVASI